MRHLSNSQETPGFKDALRIGPYTVRSLQSPDLLRRLRERMARRETSALFFANTNLVVQCADFAARFDAPAVILVNDGVGMDVAALARHGRRFAENLNGTDFVPALLKSSAMPLRIYLYGARPEVVQAAAQVIEQRYGHHVVGRCPGYHDSSLDVAAQMRATEPDMVLVALGNPRQERWILDHMDEVPGCVFIGVGALFDFLSGRAVRAPAWIRHTRLEWLFRMCREPRRLWRRYTLDAFRFLRICWARP